MRRNAILQVKKATQPRLFLLARYLDIRLSFCTGDNGTQGNCDDVNQGVVIQVGPTWIIDVAEMGLNIGFDLVCHGAPLPFWPRIRPSFRFGHRSMRLL